MSIVQVIHHDHSFFFFTLTKKKILMRLRHYNMQAVRELLNCGVNLNARNLEGHTAQDMLQEQTQVNNSMISDLLIPRKTGLFLERVRLLIKTARERSRISNDDRNALSVVAAYNNHLSSSNHPSWGTLARRQDF